MKNQYLPTGVFSLLLFTFVCFIGLPLLAQQVDMSLFHGIKPRNIGPAGMSGRVTAIDVVLKDIGIIYLGSAAGGIFKSENGGHTWKAVFENEKAASIGAIHIYQKNPDIIYVGSGEGNPRNSHNSGYGMYKSIDGGRTWQHLGLEDTRQIHRVIVHPDNPDIVTVAAMGSAWGASRSRGVYKTTDGGRTWRNMLFVNEHTGIADLIVDPTNPNKLIAATWEHRRRPWFFRSGGPGSGIYLSYDGGENWEQLNQTHGLPTGEWGRIGLAFAPARPEIVYAYIESKSNAVYRSEDGGHHWKRMSKPKEKQIGDRPFYYADIYVDSKNENRVYSLATTITVSEDGGKTWAVFAAGNKIHTDHHAWWTHPEDPDFIMVGHDGGFNITHDRGKNWWFAENLPLGQFYHVRVDDEFPYNVYGGLQDNGSWRGPSRTWFKGGIRNLYWQRISTGDGFDVVPDPLDNNYGYAMGQAGNLVRYHCPSGQLVGIKPVHPDGEYLRFNWNTGIAIDPFDRQTIYYGSQYLHKTSDYGQSWEIISPDLTTNDPEKQKFLETGGLTYDVTGAEFHTTIISIAPSPLRRGMIWAGTDDGNVQLTRDGGKTWVNCTENLADVPAHIWVQQIQASRFNEGEAFVVFDDHRRNNWEPYIYRTRNYGKSWERIVDGQDVWGYALSFEQDPVEPKLYFCGTEFGLYVSFDEGLHWNKWTNHYPSMPTQDLVLHPREHDLVIGTFGRSFWILDDVRPLREMAAKGSGNILAEALHIFPPPDAHLAIIGESIGYRHGKIGDALYSGENRPYGALITYFLRDVKKEDKTTGRESGDGNGDAFSPADSVLIQILDKRRDTVRTLYQRAAIGVNRLSWDLRRDAVRYPSEKEPDKPAPPKPGMAILPGPYTLRITYEGHSAEAIVTVLPDPRLHVLEADMQSKEEMIRAHRQQVEKVTAITDELRHLEKTVKTIAQKLQKKDPEAYGKMKDRIDDFVARIKELKAQVVSEEVQGIYRDPNVLDRRLRTTRHYLDHILTPPSENQRVQMRLAREAVEDFVAAYTQFRKQALAGFQKEIEALNIKPLD